MLFALYFSVCLSLSPLSSSALFSSSFCQPCLPCSPSSPSPLSLCLSFFQPPLFQCIVFILLLPAMSSLPPPSSPSPLSLCLSFFQPPLFQCIVFILLLPAMSSLPPLLPYRSIPCKIGRMCWCPDVWLLFCLCLPLLCILRCVWIWSAFVHFFVLICFWFKACKAQCAYPIWVRYCAIKMHIVIIIFQHISSLGSVFRGLCGLWGWMGLGQLKKNYPRENVVVRKWMVICAASPVQECGVPWPGEQRQVLLGAAPGTVLSCELQLIVCKVKSNRKFNVDDPILCVYV